MTPEETRKLYRQRKGGTSPRSRRLKGKAANRSQAAAPRKTGGCGCKKK